MYKPLYYKGLDLSKDYLISDDGKLFSLKTNKELKLHVNKNGYYQVCISLGSRGKKKVIKIHEAVAYNFVYGYNDGLIVNHKDCNKLNNYYKNLEWITNKENSIHALNNGLLKTKAVMCNETKQIFDSMTKASKWCNTTIQSIRKNINGIYNYAGKHPITKQCLTWSDV